MFIMLRCECVVSKMLNFFFFQAEDGIRGYKVTGVQTCALPISVFPAMIAATLIVIMLQVRSFSMMALVMLTAPLGLVGVVPALLSFNQPFGFNAILGLIGLAGRSEERRVGKEGRCRRGRLNSK